MYHKQCISQHYTTTLQMREPFISETLLFHFCKFFYFVYRLSVYENALLRKWMWFSNGVCIEIDYENIVK
jgi:hypothetical protein